MRLIKSIARHLFLICVFYGTHHLSTAQPSTTEASAEAWRTADQLLESLGGRDVWTSTKILYVKEKAFPESLFHPVTAEFWRDLEKPAYRSVLDGYNFHQETMWNEEEGWKVRDGLRQEITKEDIVKEIIDWSQQPFVVYHKLATRDGSITPVLKEDALQVYDTNGNHLLCWFKMDAHGRLLTWGNIYHDKILEHVYGPTKEIGNFRMPAWGTATNGSWRFEYLEVKAVDNMGSEISH